MYDAATGAERLALDKVSTPTAVSPDGSMLAATRTLSIGGLEYQSIVLWDTAAGKELHEFAPEIQSQMPLAGDRGHRIVQAMTFSPDGRSLLSTGEDAIRLWDITSGRHLRCFQTPAHAGAFSAVWGPDARTIVATVDDDTYLWDANSNFPTAMFGQAGQAAEDPASLAAAARGRWISWPAPTGWGTEGRKAYLWDLATRRLLAIFPVTGYIGAAAISPAGDRAVTLDDPAGPAGAPFSGYDTILWDAKQAASLDLPSAQQSYWDALAAAVAGKPLADQQRLLRKAEIPRP